MSPARRALMLFLCLVMAGSAVGLTFRLWEYHAAAREYAGYAELMDEPQPSPEASPEPASAAAQAQTVPAAMTPIPAATQIPYFSDQIRGLLGKNPDAVGYIDIPGTTIQYPVAQCGDNQYYAAHTFSRKKNPSGAIYMDCGSSPDLTGFNTVLYGHNMKDGSMFHELLQYMKESFAQDHRKIVFTGLYHQYTYYVCAAYSSPKGDDVRGFGARDDDSRAAFLRSAWRRTIITPGSSTPTSQGHFLTLVTCRENSAGDYFVVHAVRME